MDNLVKESEYFVAWLLVWLCSLVGGFLLGAFVFGIAAFILGAVRVDLDTGKAICGALGFLSSIPLSYVVFRLFVGAMIVKRAQTRAASTPAAREPPQFESMR